MSRDQKAAYRRWYAKLKADPERYLARAERGEKYAAEHREHLLAEHRISDKKRHKAIMADPVRHEARLAYRRELHRKRMKEDPAYREKLRKRAKANNAKRRELHKSDPSLRKKFNEDCAFRQKARRDFLKSTPDGRAILRKKDAEQRLRAMADPVRHEKRKSYARAYAAKYRQTEAYRTKKAAKKKKRQQALRKKKRMQAYRSTPEYKAKRRIAWQEWSKKNPDKVKAIRDRAKKKREIRFRSDPDFYAHERERHRLWHKKKLSAKGKKYIPRPACRIPDHCTKGNVLDRTSPYLRNNLSPDQIRSADSFAADLSREERDYSHSHNLL